MTRRISFRGAFPFLLLSASVSTCAQTVVLEDQTDAGRTNTQSDGSSSDGRCLGKPLPFTQETPEMVVALDRSSAMNAPFADDPSQLGSALDALGAEILHFGAQPQNNQPLVRFAFIDFPDTATDCNAMLGCCSSDVTPTSNYTAFEAASNAACTAPNSCLDASQRPTTNALVRSQSFLSEDSLPGEHYVLLVTDGPPSGCDASGRDCNDALTEIGQLQNAGIQTTIVSIGDGSTTAGCLLNLASAEGAAGPPYYYTATSPNDLTTTIENIVNNVAQGACRLDLSNPPNAPDQLSVLFNGAQIPRDTSHNGGWDFSGNGGSHIMLYGMACQDLMQYGTFSFEVTAGCSTGHGGQTGP